MELTRVPQNFSNRAINCIASDCWSTLVWLFVRPILTILGILRGSYSYRSCGFHVIGLLRTLSHFHHLSTCFSRPFWGGLLCPVLIRARWDYFSNAFFHHQKAFAVLINFFLSYRPHCKCGIRPYLLLFVFVLYLFLGLQRYLIALSCSFLNLRGLRSSLQSLGGLEQGSNFCCWLVCYAQWDADLKPNVP